MCVRLCLLNAALSKWDSYDTSPLKSHNIYIRTNSSVLVHVCLDILQPFFLYDSIDLTFSMAVVVGYFKSDHQMPMQVLIKFFFWFCSLYWHITNCWVLSSIFIAHCYCQQEAEAHSTLNASVCICIYIHNEHTLSSMCVHWTKKKAPESIVWHRTFLKFPNKFPFLHTRAHKNSHRLCENL